MTREEVDEAKKAAEWGCFTKGHKKQFKIVVAALEEAERLMSTLTTNAVIGPDAFMQGLTDCNHVPFDDVDAMKKFLGVKS